MVRSRYTNWIRKANLADDHNVIQHNNSNIIQLYHRSLFICWKRTNCNTRSVILLSIHKNKTYRSEL